MSLVRCPSNSLLDSVTSPGHSCIHQATQSPRATEEECRRCQNFELLFCAVAKNASPLREHSISGVPKSRSFCPNGLYGFRGNTIQCTAPSFPGDSDTEPEDKNRSWVLGLWPTTKHVSDTQLSPKSFLLSNNGGFVSGSGLWCQAPTSPRGLFSWEKSFSPSCRDLWVCALALRMCQTHLNPSRGQSLGPWDRSFYLYLPLAQGA